MLSRFNSLLLNHLIRISPKEQAFDNTLRIVICRNGNVVLHSFGRSGRK